MRSSLSLALILDMQRRVTTHAHQSHPWVMVWTMAVAQVISWGTLFYAFSLFVVPMQESLGWSRPLLNGALSLGLLSTGVMAFPVGAWIDRHGGRGVMTLGSLVGGLLLLAWAYVETPWVFYLLWVLIGASMAGVLYEPAFVVITAVFGPDARRGITALTLVGGFASTVFMPLTQLLIGAVGWRSTPLVLGGLNLAVCLPLHALFVPGPPASRSPAAPQEEAPTAHAMRTMLRGRVFVGLAVTVLLPAALLILLCLPPTLLWLGLVATLYGAGNGIMTIVRGIAVSDLLGRTHYGAINGALTVPTTVAKALAPAVAAALWSVTGDPALMLWTMLGSALVGTLGFAMALSGASR